MEFLELNTICMIILSISCVMPIGIYCDDTTQLPRCSDPSMENPGYSSVQSQGRTLWSHCGFPNPKLEQRRCGRTYQPGLAYDICDPDQVIDSDSKNYLDQSLWAVEKTTPEQCTPWHGAVLNYTILLVAVRYLRVPDLSKNETCINSCGEIVPDLDDTTRSANSEEHQQAIDNFAVGLVDNFKGYFCDNFLVIAYWYNETLISTALTEGTSKRVSTSVIDTVTARALEYLEAGDTQQAFQTMITEYRKHILGFTPAYIMFTIHMILIVLIALCVVLYILFGGKSDYYDDEQWKVAMKTFMKILFGIWFVETLFTVLVHVQDKIRLWIIVIPLVGLIIAIVAAVLLHRMEEELIKSGPTNTN